MAERKNNKVSMSEVDYSALQALLHLEWYCLEMRGTGHDNCKSCVMSVLLKDGEGCPFDDLAHAPGDLEVREEVYNSGTTLSVWHEITEKDFTKK